MLVVSLHKDPVGRLLREGVDMVAGNQTILLNSKEEFLQGAVPSLGPREDSEDDITVAEQLLFLSLKGGAS